uniref:Uncharacterized protein n=1 Tax=Parastrongyloides trichosuri TaxID=131310 RepID=A0A0N4Z0C1_PARTI
MDQFSLLQKTLLQGVTGGIANNLQGGNNDLFGTFNQNALHNSYLYNNQFLNIDLKVFDTQDLLSQQLFSINQGSGLKELNRVNEHDENEKVSHTEARPTKSNKRGRHSDKIINQSVTIQKKSAKKYIPPKVSSTLEDLKSSEQVKISETPVPFSGTNLIPMPTNGFCWIDEYGNYFFVPSKDSKIAYQMLPYNQVKKNDKKEYNFIEKILTPPSSVESNYTNLYDHLNYENLKQQIITTEKISTEEDKFAFDLLSLLGK